MIEEIIILYEKKTKKNGLPNDWEEREIFRHKTYMTKPIKKKKKNYGQR